MDFATFTHGQLHLMGAIGRWESQGLLCCDQVGTDTGTPGFDGSENQLDMGAASPAAGTLA